MPFYNRSFYFYRAIFRSRQRLSMDNPSMLRFASIPRHALNEIVNHGRLVQGFLCCLMVADRGVNPCLACFIMCTCRYDLYVAL